MFIALHSDHVVTRNGDLLLAEYQQSDTGPGRLTLNRVPSATEGSRETELRLDPADPDGFRIEEWAAAGGLVVCGAQRIVVLELATLEVRASIPLEYRECRLVGQPSIVEAPGVLLIGSEHRLFCVDHSLRVRWCWTTRVFSDDLWVIAESPTTDGSSVCLSMMRIMDVAEVHLDARDGTEISRRVH